MLVLGRDRNEPCNNLRVKVHQVLVFTFSFSTEFYSAQKKVQIIWVCISEMLALKYIIFPNAEAELDNKGHRDKIRPHSFVYCPFETALLTFVEANYIKKTVPGQDKVISF